MAYTKTVWEDYPSEDTIIDAAKLNNMEDGIEDAHTQLGTKLAITSKAIGTDVTAGTDDTKYVTSKAIKDANVNVGVWTSYTPATANITVGNGTLTASYCRIGNTIHFYINFILGSTSAISTSPYFALPVTAKIANIVSTVILLDANVGLYFGTLEPSANGALPTTILSNGTYTSLSAITSSVPFIWTTSDFIKISGTYEAA